MGGAESVVDAILNLAEEVSGRGVSEFEVTVRRFPTTFRAMLCVRSRVGVGPESSLLREHTADSGDAALRGLLREMLADLKTKVDDATSQAAKLRAMLEKHGGE